MESKALIFILICYGNNSLILITLKSAQNPFERQGPEVQILSSRPVISKLLSPHPRKQPARFGLTPALSSLRAMMLFLLVLTRMDRKQTNPKSPEPEADAGKPPVAIRRAAISRRVAPRAAAKHAVGVVTTS